MRKVFHIILIIIGALSFVAAIIIFWRFISLVSQNHEMSPDFDPVITQTIGAFIGGVVPVFLSITTIILIYLTYQNNREELEKLNRFNNQLQFDNNFNRLHDALEKINNNNREDYDKYFNGTNKILSDLLYDISFPEGPRSSICFSNLDFQQRHHEARLRIAQCRQLSRAIADISGHRSDV